MALSGVHVACVRIGAYSSQGGMPLPLALGAPSWSENLTSAATSTSVVPVRTPGRSDAGQWAFIVSAAADAYVAVGPSPGTPSATNGFLVLGGQSLSIAVHPGWTWAWAAA